MKKILIAIVLVMILSFYWVLRPKKTSEVHYCKFSCPSGFIHTHGIRLFLDNQEYREIGFNVYQILHTWYLERGEEFKNGKGREIGIKVLKDLSEHDFRLIRFMAGPFWPAEFFQDFFDNNPEKQKQKQARFFEIFDKLLDDLDKFKIKAVVSVVWNQDNFADLGGHSLHKGITDFESPGYRKCQAFITEIVARYHQRKTIAWWEIPGNEYDLTANRHSQSPAGVIRGYSTGDILRPWSVVRGSLNNFNSNELSRFFCELISYVRTDVDKNHLITTGTAQEYPFHHERMGKETDNEHKKCIVEQHRCADIVSIHHYLTKASFKEVLSLEWYNEISKKIGKPLFIGEIGPGFERTHGINGEIIKGGDYTKPEGIADIEKKSRTIVELCIPASTWWTYKADNKLFNLEFGVTDEALKIIERDNRKIKTSICFN